MNVSAQMFDKFHINTQHIFFPQTNISLDIGATAELFGHLDTVMCRVSACYTLKQLQMAYER